MKQELHESRLAFLVRQYQRLDPEQQASIDYLIEKLLDQRPPPQNVIPLDPHRR